MEALLIALDPGNVLKINASRIPHRSNTDDSTQSMQNSVENVLELRTPKSVGRPSLQRAGDSMEREKSACKGRENAKRGEREHIANEKIFEGGLRTKWFGPPAGSRWCR